MDTIIILVLNGLMDLPNSYLYFANSAEAFDLKLKKRDLLIMGSIVTLGSVLLITFGNLFFDKLWLLLFPIIFGHYFAKHSPDKSYDQLVGVGLLLTSFNQISICLSDLVSTYLVTTNL